MATKTLRVFAEYTSTGFVPMPTLGNIDYGYTLGSTFPATTPTSFQTDNPDLVVTVTAMTDFYVWIRINGTAWNPSYTRNVRVYPDSPNINNVVMNMIIATGPAGVSSYTQIVQTSNRLYFNGATTDAVYDSKFAGKTYINELNFGTAPGLATVATSGAYADLTGKPTLATVATSGLFTDLSSKPSGTAPLSYNSGTNSFVITQANTSTNGYLSSTDWNTFNNKFATPAGTTLQYVDGTGALQTFPVLASADKLVINVRNSSGVSMPKGSVVYINGATGNKPTVALSQGNSDATSAQTLGLLQTTLANNAEGNVIIVGAVTDLNTSAFTEGQQLYLSPTTAGAYTTTKPYAPSHLVYVGVVTRSHVSLGVIEVKVQNGYEMDELHNVSAQSPSNNDGLFYNTTTSLWEKKSIATVLGYTPYNGTDTSIKALFSATTPLSYSNGVYGISQATTSSNGYLSSTDWNTFNGKESVLSFTTPLVRTTNTISINQASASTSGFLSSTDWNTFNNKGSGTGSVTSVAMTMPLGLSVSGSPITTSGTFGITLTAGYVIPSTTSTGQWDTAYTNRITSLTLNGSSGTATLASNVLNIPSYTLVGLGGVPTSRSLTINGTAYDLSADRTWSVGTVTSVSALTLGTTGTDVSSTVATGTTTPVITLNIPTASATNRGALSSADWTTFNNKASALSGTTNYVAKFNSSSTISNSSITDDGSSVTSLINFNVAKSNAVATINSTNTGGYSVLKILSSTIPDLWFGRESSTSSLFGLTASASLIYSEGAYPFLLFVNGATRLTIASTGAATFSSSVTAATKFISSVGNNQIVFESLSATTGYQYMQLLNTTAHTIFGIEGTTAGSLLTGGLAYGSVFTSVGNTALQFGTNQTARMTITPTGNVGIGTSTPVGKLDVTLINNRRFIVTYDDSIITIKGASDTGGGENLRIIGDSLIFNTNYVGSGTERMRITSTGNVGIGTNSPLDKLHVQESATSGSIRLGGGNGAGNARMFFYAHATDAYIDMYGNNQYLPFKIYCNPLSLMGGNVSINYAGDAGYRLYVSGTIYATSNITANSDLTLKKNLEIITNPIDKLMSLNGYLYQWKENDEYQYGVIAQEVEKILPYAVSSGKNGIKGVAYNQITPLLIEGFKSHESEITILKARVKYLESKLA
jgi:hypothetical protein